MGERKALKGERKALMEKKMRMKTSLCEDEDGKEGGGSAWR